ncbi:E2 ubiquitin-conjugating enzyme [Purpureocillium takamizusanense]|uniref:Ubiquitin-conjugating enzyme E2 2 n=1 Tax=Purpureocillium takamizusanense TaxID=2060973 RepID=A0A9Q8QRP3_9HYPO|nr:E2 ubiquitin-conjugating enzyme [Purpureocillium takamizusanense]UNI23626.1 E2 ubiquitin-conjugating enzyme [Purpureocillium takamizusanense]
MDYAMDSQNSAPGSVQAAKLNGSRKGPDSQSVTKRFVHASPRASSHLCRVKLADPRPRDRLQTELMTLMTSPAPGVSAFPSADGNLLSWTATIEGPDDTPYAGLTFKLSFAFPSNYPYAAPTVLFKTPIYHPNVDFSGRICLDILKDKWTAAYNIQTVLLSLQSLLGEPNNASPLNGEAAELWDKDPQEFKTKVLARHRDVEDE